MRASGEEKKLFTMMMIIIKMRSLGSCELLESRFEAAKKKKKKKQTYLTDFLLTDLA